MKEKTFFNWSCGKDSALVYYKAKEKGNFDMVTLFTSVTEENMRVFMHGVPVDLAKQQAKGMEVLLRIFGLSADSSAEETAFSYIVYV